MRYGPAENLLRLARRLAGTRVGLTLDEMAAELGCSRRTIERMRDSLAALFPELDVTEDDGRVRRWRLPASALNGLSAPTPECIAALESAARDYHSRGEESRATLLRDGATALRTLINPQALCRAETDIAALMEAEGVAMRPGPRPIIGRPLLATLRHAILGMRLIAVRYASPTTGTSTRLLCPYALLYGGRGWLIAHADGTPDLHLWRLDRILSADTLDRTFPRDENFSLPGFAARAFGVFQEDPIEVTLRFAPSAAQDAASWQFHPSQTLEPQEDGSLIVTFHAGGTREICWHLFTWGDTVQILAPATLRDEMREMLLAALAVTQP